MGIELSLTSSQIDRVFWDAASPAVPTEGIEEFLLYLKERRIRTGVISNIPYWAEVVQERIRRLLPFNDFEFILTSSEYMFRKPHARIFQLALEKADLQPEDVWYIGDNYQCDVVGARNVGIFPVYYIGASKMQPEEDEMCIRDRAVEDKRRGLYSYEALRSRLAEGKFSKPGARDLLAPVIRLEALTPEEMMVLCEKLSDIHADLYGYPRRLGSCLLYTSRDVGLLLSSHRYAG